MRIVKLPHLPSDSAKAQPGDLIPDVWYKGKEYQVEQTQEEQYIKMKNIVIFGAPGSGKGTQSDKLIEHYGLEHISTGDVLRAEIKKGSELGQTAQQYIDQGQLIPDELMKRLILRGQQSGRADDNEETIRKRLMVYHSQTQPLIEWYRKEGLHHHIDGLGELDRIFADICKVIDKI